MRVGDVVIVLNTEDFYSSTESKAKEENVCKQFLYSIGVVTELDTGGDLPYGVEIFRKHKPKYCSNFDIWWFKEDNIQKIGRL